MLNHYRVKLLRVPFVVVAAASMVILFTPESGVPTAPPGTDKVVHLALFAALTVTGRVAGIGPVALAVGLCGYAGASELLQSLLPIGRNGGVLDAAVDVAGIACGWWGLRLYHRVWPPRTPRDHEKHVGSR